MLFPDTNIIFRRLPLILLAFLIFGLQSACASNPQDSMATARSDSWEPFNRKIFAFNEWADRWVMKPAATAYRWVTPQFVDKGVTNMFKNLQELRNMLNNGLQGKPGGVSISLGRFLINSTLGIFGFFDVASSMGIPKYEEDFGQTMASWGMGSGPYIVLPFFGPTTLRDGVMQIPDTLSDLETYIEPERDRLLLKGLYYVDIRADLLDAEELIEDDRYRFFRDVYIQNRAFDIADGEVEDDFGDEDF